MKKVEKIEDLQKLKIAIVADWIKDFGGAELVLSHIMEAFPKADIYTSVFFSKHKVFENKNIKTSFIQKIPFLNKSHKLALTLRPRAFESFDLSEYDVVITSTSAESKGVITKPETLQICYCHTPTRYFWSHYHEYLNMMEFWILNFLWKWLMPKLVHNLRKWDLVASFRPDYFIANSKNTASRINKYYKRKANVIYPSLDLSEFKFCNNKADYYLYVWRCIPYKKFDLIVDAFNKNSKKLILCTNTDNKLYRELKGKSKENIEWIFNPSREKLIKLYGEAKAFLFPPEEDFWLVPVEAMATGTPIIAYGKWWGLETVVENKTWVFFGEQTSESLNKKIEDFEKLDFDSNEIRKHAENFDKEVFKENLKKFILEKINKK